MYCVIVDYQAMYEMSIVSEKHAEATEILFKGTKEECLKYFYQVIKDENDLNSFEA